MEPKLPKVKMRMVGEDGEAFAILCRFKQAAREAKWPKNEIQRVLDGAMSGSYDHLLATILKHVKRP